MLPPIQANPEVGALPSPSCFPGLPSYMGKWGQVLVIDNPGSKSTAKGDIHPQMWTASLFRDSLHLFPGPPQRATLPLASSSDPAGHSHED